MKLPIYVLLLTVATSPLLAQSDTTLAPATDYQVRVGLPNFFRKVQQHKPVHIVYFGGSITEAAKGWRDQSMAWFEQTYPGTRFTQTNAAVGGTGSDLGVFRLQQDVLIHKPDLVFVEFAVNDNSAKPDLIGRSMEGIVRQIWRDNPATDICFVYTLMAAMAPALENGKLPRSATVMEKIATHYGIPSVFIGSEVIRLVKEGKMRYAGKPDEFPGQLVFSGDNVHPYPTTGHRLYAEAIARAMPIIGQVKARPARSRLKEPLYPDPLVNVRLLPATQVTHSAGWQVLSAQTDSIARQFQNRLPTLLKATQPGEWLKIRFRGTQVGLYDIIGPGCGQYSVRVDGQPAVLYPRFDMYASFYRTHYFLLPPLPEGEHTVELALAAEPLDKAMILQKRNVTITDPARYAPSAVYAGQLLLVGELLPN